MIWTLLRPLLNPSLILGLLAVFFVTSTAKDVMGFFKTQDLIKPWQEAVVERDKAIKRKDQLTQEALKDRDAADAEIQRLNVELDAAAATRLASGAIDCRWTDDDARVLNSTAKRTP